MRAPPVAIHPNRRTREKTPLWDCGPNRGVGACQRGIFRSRLGSAADTAIGEASGFGQGRRIDVAEVPQRIAAHHLAELLEVHRAIFVPLSQDDQDVRPFGRLNGIREPRHAAGVTAKKMWGDGFYVTDSEDVAFCSVAAINNRRQGLSIISVDRLLVTNSVFRDTRGTRPSAGIDMEPDKPDELVSNVRIENSKFIDNAGGGIIIAGKKGESACATKQTSTSDLRIRTRGPILDDAL